ncbi:NAD(P)H-hydrate dehydratase [Clostridium cylindrosporum]|uniref:Multifunctional fusion protein n=1 Tax=Clostridium cylindrosporum DSM 605 TaxID=1121307 RepID=A0A0J8D4M3_CLOCY|nr:NAD(P)H-hydrate dehydratase [Clostridium cylindrosporum]KMT21115.1 nnr: bifunctional NAD(P)H-hydrate repair enzyme Nnr [Clostridium cylindrosporum DSM 605]
MVFGTGIDIIKIERVARLIEKEAFMKKFFTDREREYLKHKRAESAAGYFSAKEAIVKSMGTGFTGFKFKDVEVLREDNEPFVILHGNARKIAEDMGIGTIKVSISHEKDFAISSAIALKEVKGRGKEYLLKEYPLNILRKRENNSHKGTYGKVSIIGGSYTMSGAAILAANAALRTGSGLVNCVIPECIIERVASSVYEATYTPLNHSGGTINLTQKDINLILEKSDALSIGTGIGFEEKFLKPIEEILKLSRIPIVIDADAINILALDVNILKKERECSVILTPHPLEMSRLTGLSVNYINSNREEVAKKFAKEHNCILLLKGHETVVSNGDKVYINKSGNPGMATGGSGDVLTGIICSLLGQGYTAYESGVLGSYIHGLAGDMAYEVYGYGLKASDITNYIGQYVK